MSEFQVSAALLRTTLVARPASSLDSKFERGEGTRAVTHAHLRQAASLATDHVVRAVSRRRPIPEERVKQTERRRKWGGGSKMPDHLRARFSEGERAALSVVAQRCKESGFCVLCVDAIANIAGVGRTTVQNAIRKASGRCSSTDKRQPLISVRERPQTGGKNLPNVIKIICASWLSWISRIGFKRLSTSESESKITSVEREGAISSEERCDRKKVLAADVFSAKEDVCSTGEPISPGATESRIWTRPNLSTSHGGHIENIPAENVFALDLTPKRRGLAFGRLL